MITGETVLRGQDLSKRFGSIVALHDVDIELRRGEITALCGDNGAGKSTLIGMLSGALQPTTGTIEIHGAPVRFKSPRDAKAAGVETVFQDLGLAPDLTVTENVFLAREVRRRGVLGLLGMVDRRAMREATAKAVERVRINLPSLEHTVESMSGGQRQAVAVARALAGGGDAVLLDEPTAALGVRETAQVVQLIESLREAGVAVLMISHDLPVVVDVSDRVIVLRHGTKVADIATPGHSVDDVIGYITGHRVDEFAGESR